MTVERLLNEASSYELTAWQQFFVVDAERVKEAREQARVEAEINV